MSKFRLVESPIPADNPPTGEHDVAFDSVDGEFYVKDSVGVIKKFVTTGGVSAIIVKSLGNSNTTSASFQTKLALVTPAATGTFIIEFSSLFFNSGDNGEVQIFNQTLATELFLCNYNSSNSDKFAVGGFIDIALTGSAETIEIRFRDVSGGNQQDIESARLYFHEE